MAARSHQLTCWQMVIWCDRAAIWRMTMSLRLELAFFERTANVINICFTAFIYWTISSNKVHHLVVLVKLVHLMYILPRFENKFFFQHFWNQGAWRPKMLKKNYVFKPGQYIYQLNQLNEYYKVVHFVQRYCSVYECSKAKIGHSLASKNVEKFMFSNLDKIYIKWTSSTSTTRWYTLFDDIVEYMNVVTQKFITLAKRKR